MIGLRPTAYEIARQMTYRSLLGRLKCINSLEQQGTMAPKRQSLEFRGARRHVWAALKTISIAKDLKNLKIPKYEDMSGEEWIEEKGNFHLRHLAKAFGLLGPIVPYETEAQGHLLLCFGNSVDAKRGNIILPFEHLKSPFVRYCGEISPSSFYSLMLFDADNVFNSSGRFQPLCLWAKTNINSSEFIRGCTPSKEDAFQYMTPILARGTNMHRIVAIVIKHEEIFNLSRDGDFISQRSFRIHDKLTEKMKVIGYQFFRTCWTAQVANSTIPAS